MILDIMSDFESDLEELEDELKEFINSFFSYSINDIIDVIKIEKNYFTIQLAKNNHFYKRNNKFVYIALPTCYYQEIPMIYKCRISDSIQLLIFYWLIWKNGIHKILYLYKLYDSQLYYKVERLFKRYASKHLRQKIQLREATLDHLNHSQNQFVIEPYQFLISNSLDDLIFRYNSIIFNYHDKSFNSTHISKDYIIKYDELSAINIELRVLNDICYIM